MKFIHCAKVGVIRARASTAVATPDLSHMRVSLDRPD